MSSNTGNAIDQLIEDAKDSTPAVTGSQTDTTSTAAQTPAATSSAPPRSLEAFSEMGMSVDHFLKADTRGISVGEDPKLFKEIEVEIRLDEVCPNTTLRYEVAGAGVQYVKTYDGVTTDRGESWAAAQQKANRVGEKVSSYDSFDVPGELTGELKGDNETFEAGETVGFSLSPTSGGQFKKFLKRVKRSGGVLSGPDASVVRVLVGSEKKTNAQSGSKGYAVFNFGDFEIVDE